MGFELFQSDRTIGVFVDLLERAFRALRILLCPRCGFEFIEAYGPAGIRIELLEDLLEIRAGTLRAAWTLRFFRPFLGE